MAYSKAGEGNFGANQNYAGRLYDGAVTLTSSTYSITDALLEVAMLKWG